MNCNFEMTKLPNNRDDPFWSTPFSRSVSLEMQGVRIRVRSNCKELVSYVRDHVHGFAIPAATDHHIEVNVLWLEMDEYDPHVHRFAGLDRLGRIGKRVLGGQDQLVWLDLLAVKRLQLRFRLEDTKLIVDAIYHFDPSRKSPEQRPMYKYKRFFSLTKYFVYFPVAWYLEHFRDIYLLHASAVALNGKAVIIAGVGGVGKTTTCVALLSQDGAKLISENLVFYDERQIYGCYEPIRADDDSLALIGETNGCLLSSRILPRVKDKNVFHVERGQLVEHVPAGSLFIPKFSTPAGVTPLDLDVCVDKLMSINTQTREVNDYYWFAATLGLLWPKADRATRRIAELTELLSQAGTYELNIDPEAGVGPVVDMILQHAERIV